MALLISLLYLLLHIAVIALCAALILWALRWFGIALDPMVMKIGQFILAIIVVILIVSWAAGVLPPRGLLGGRMSAPALFPTFLAGASLNVRL